MEILLTLLVSAVFGLLSFTVHLYREIKKLREVALAFRGYITAATDVITCDNAALHRLTSMVDNLNQQDMKLMELMSLLRRETEEKYFAKGDVV